MRPLVVILQIGFPLFLIWVNSAATTVTVTSLKSTSNINGSASKHTETRIWNFIRLQSLRHLMPEPQSSAHLPAAAAPDCSHQASNSWIGTVRFTILSLQHGLEIVLLVTTRESGSECGMRVFLTSGLPSKTPLIDGWRLVWVVSMTTIFLFLGIGKCVCMMMHDGK